MTREIIANRYLDHSETLTGSNQLAEQLRVGAKVERTQVGGRHGDGEISGHARVRLETARELGRHGI